MRQLQPILWTRGTLLTPQQLQAQDRFLEDSLHFRLEAVSFRPWGFTNLQVDRDALANGLFAISSAAGIFPDGLLFDMPDADEAPSAEPLAEHFGASDYTADVYLAILHAGTQNVSQPGGKG